LNSLDHATAKNLADKAVSALNLAHFAVERERGAFASLVEICTGSEKAVSMIENRIKQWEFYGKGLEKQLWSYAAWKAKELGAATPAEPEPTEEERKYAQIFPSIHRDAKGQEFYLERTDRYKKFIKEHPEAIKELRVSRMQKRSIQNFINGHRSITTIRNFVAADTGTDLLFPALLGYLEFLKKLDWIAFNEPF